MGTASRVGGWAVEISDQARRSLCGHRQNLDAPRGAAVPPPTAELALKTAISACIIQVGLLCCVFRFPAETTALAKT